VFGRHQSHGRARAQADGGRAAYPGSDPGQPASFVTPNIRENAKLQRWVRAKAPLAYAINPFDPHLLHMFMQLLYSPMQANPLEVQYYSNVPFLLGEDQAVREMLGIAK
jgi:hypothetical protein